MSREAKLRAFKNLGRPRGEVRERIRGERLGRKDEEKQQKKKKKVDKSTERFGEEGARMMVGIRAKTHEKLQHFQVLNRGREDLQK